MSSSETVLTVKSYVPVIAAYDYLQYCLASVRIEREEKIFCPFSVFKIGGRTSSKLAFVPFSSCVTVAHSNKIDIYYIYYLTPYHSISNPN